MNFLQCLLFILFFIGFCNGMNSSQRLQYREKVRSMVYHAYNNYLKNGFPHDEVSPLSCTGKDTWGRYSLTLIDSLDTLAVRS
jgi:hypothetical protein